MPRVARAVQRKSFTPQVRLRLVEDDIDRVEDNHDELENNVTRALRNMNRLLISLLTSMCVAALMLVLDITTR